MALHAGESVRWVADQLGHSDPALTLRVYAHPMRDEESDLSFAEFGDSERLYPAPTESGELSDTPNYKNSMARREGNYRFPGPWFIFNPPRGRVMYEERGTVLPPWFFRRVWPAMVPPVRWLFALGLRRYRRRGPGA